MRLHEQLRSRGAYQGEATYQTRFGSTFPVEVVVQRVEQGGREFILLLARDATERKRAEDALTESAERFRALFDESPVAALLLDAGFRVIGVNRAASATVGYSIEELTGRDPELFVLADDQLGFRQMRDRLLAGSSQSEAAERRLVHRDGSLVWTKVNVRAVAAGNGLRHYLVVLENFTDRKIFEEQLQVALRDQQTLFETMSVGVAQAMSGKIMLANREFADMFGYRDGQVIGMPLWDLTIDRDNRMPNEISGMPVVRANQTTSGEVVLFRKDGEPIWCLVQARPIQSEASGPDGLREAIYTFQNVSEMKRQREALSRSLLELNVVLDATSMGVLHLQDDRVVRCNAQAQVMFGHPGSALVGTPVGALFSAESDYFESITSLRAQLATGAPASFEGLMKGRNGAFWALVSLRKVDAKVGAKGMIASILDISERKKQEEELQTALAQQQLIFDTALVGLLFVRDGRPVRANSAMEELMACDPGGLVNQMQLFTHPTDHLLLASLAEHYPRIAESGACEFELYMYRRKADPIWVAVQGRAVSPERPELGYIFAFVNIDERKRSERELRSTLNELQLIFDNALVAMLYVANDLILKANAATERLFGYDPRDYSELVVSTLFAHPADWDRVSTEVMDAAGGDERYSFELLMQRADGSTFWCAGNGTPLDPAAPERGLILTLMDVDARRRSEEELRRVRNYLDLVVENLPVLVSVREAETGRFVSLNRAGEQITGLSRQQVVGRTWREVYARQFADLYAELDRKALATGTQVDRPRDVMLRADGKRLTVNQRVVPLFEPGPGVESHPRYVMSIIDDLTEEVRAEVALRETEARFRQFAENIDQLVFIMTGDFSERAVRQPALRVADRRAGRGADREPAQCAAPRDRRGCAHHPAHAAAAGGPHAAPAANRVHGADQSSIARCLPRQRAAESGPDGRRCNPGFRRRRGRDRTCGGGAPADGGGRQAARHPRARSASPHQEQPAGRGGTDPAGGHRAARGRPRARGGGRPDPGDRAGARAADPLDRHLAGARRCPGHLPEPDQHVRCRNPLRAAAAGPVALRSARKRGGAARARHQRTGHQRDQAPQHARPGRPGARGVAAGRHGVRHRESGAVAARLQPGGHRRERVGPRAGEGAAAASRCAPVDRSLRQRLCWRGCSCSRRPFARRMSDALGRASVRC